MSTHSSLIRGAAVISVFAALGSPTPAVSGAQEEPFDEAQLFFELNDTDGDLGIHALIDGEAWKQLDIEDPNERTLLDIYVTGRLRRQGLTEIFFESAEPSFDELAPAEFFKRFPAGTYEVSGTLLGGGELESSMALSHVMPAPPARIRIGGRPAATDCDAPRLPQVPANQTLTIRWDAVTTSHPDVGVTGPVTIAEYEVIVEADGVKYAATLPPSRTWLHVPASVLALADEFKLEILARATNLNRTAVETCFEVQ